MADSKLPDVCAELLAQRLESVTRLYRLGQQFAARALDGTVVVDTTSSDG